MQKKLENQNSQIKDSKMDTKLYEIRKSDIHGNGVFATCLIPEGTKIMEYLGDLLAKDEANERGLAYEAEAEKTKDGSVYIFELSEELFIDGKVDYNDAKYINHSCETNAEAVQEDNQIFFYATKDIQEGEEILFNYGYALEHFLDHKCKCGSKNCCGYIVSVEDRPKLRKLLQNRNRRKGSSKNK